MSELSNEQIEKEIFDLRWKIASKENLIDLGIITNDRTLRMTNRDIIRWKKQIQELTHQKIN
jgi:predicted  nucleic acid-binding Zn-ribbon protein